jgi:hypothetical protein
MIAKNSPMNHRHAQMILPIRAANGQKNRNIQYDIQTKDLSLMSSASNINTTIA